MNKLIISGIIIGGLSFWGNAARAQTGAKVLSPQQAAELVGGPTDIDLYVSDKTPEEFFDVLWDNAGLPSFKGYADFLSKEPLVTLQMSHASFWQIVRQASQKWNVSVTEKWLDGSRHRLSPRTQPAMQGQVITSGPFMLVAGSLGYEGTHSIVFDAGSKTEDKKEKAGFSFDLYSDPKVPLVPDQGEVIVTEAMTSSGKSLLPENGHSRSLREEGQFVWNTGISLNPEAFDNAASATNANSTATFKGYVQTEFVAKSQTWKVANLANAKGASHSFTKQDQSGPVITCQIADVEAAKEGYSLTLILDGTNNWPQAQELFRMVRNNLRALDAAGQDMPVQLQRSRGSLQTGKITAHFKVTRKKHNLQTGPVTLLVKVATDIQTVKIPFEFRDIPLP